MKMVRIIDENGNFIRDEFIENLTNEKYVDGEVPQGFILPKWNGTNWVEGGIAPTPVAAEPTMEERMAVIEQDNSTILDLLAGELGVTL